MSARPLAPTSLHPIVLLEFTRLFAAEVAAGQYPYVRYDEQERWHQRIYRDQRVDVWLISWLPTQGTSLHDHGGSAGAFTVIEGELIETVDLTRQRRSGPALREIPRRAGDSIAFSPSYIHDVRNASQTPAVSVHAYSSPLTSMTYYDLEGRELQPIATVRTDDPEHELTVDDLLAAS